MEKIKDKRYLIAVALATAVVVVFVCWPPAAVEAVYPFDRARTLLTHRVLPSLGAMFRAGAVSAENRRLKREIGELSLVRGEADRLSAENARLRAALDFRRRTGERWIPAEVLSSGGGSVGVRRILRLSKGQLDGVVRGAVVVVPEGLVGRVVSVTPHTAAVMLATDPSLRVACEVETGTGAPSPRGILSGGTDEGLELRYLTRAADLVASRQRVVTSGLGGVFPRGIPVGSLVGREGASGVVRLSADLSDLEFVFIRHEN